MSTQAPYELVLKEYIGRFKPTDIHENFLVQSMADSAWRMQRLRNWELQLLDDCAANSNPFEDGDQYKKLQRAHRHIQSIERSYHRAHAALAAGRMPAQTVITKQTQSATKPFPIRTMAQQHAWKGEVNVSLKNPGVAQNPAPDAVRTQSLRS